MKTVFRLPVAPEGFGLWSPAGGQSSATISNVFSLGGQAECQSQTRTEADRAQLIRKEEGTVKAVLLSGQQQDSMEWVSAFRCFQTVGKKFQFCQELVWAGRKHLGEKLPVLK